MNHIVRATLVITGINHLLVTLLTFIAPMWFFTYVGYFPPFNAHFLADIGAFNAPLGVGLLLAARDPFRHRLLITLAAIGNLGHAISHLRDFHLHLPPNMPLVVGMTQQVLVLLIGIILLAIVAYSASVRPTVLQTANKGAV